MEKNLKKIKEEQMSERSLAHIEKVIDLQPIPNADNLEVATILGWQCVVRKGEVKVGDLVVYVEIDSVVPDTPYFEFMRTRRFRVRTIKLRGQVSQGLIIPLYSLKDVNKDLDIRDTSFHEGEDLTKHLNITKYLTPSEREELVVVPRKKHNWFIKYMTRFSWYRKLFHIKSKSFPEWIKKTDEPRIQNMPWVFTKYKDIKFNITEKLDGQSATYWYKRTLFGGEFGICSRTVRKSEFDGSTWSKVAKQLNIKKKLKEFGLDLAIQGEIIGPSIQGNKYKLGTYDFYIFNTFDIKTKEYLDRYTTCLLADCLGLKVVPLVSCTNLPLTCNDVVELSKGKSLLANVDREGLVWRDVGNTISFKSINPDFLLKNEE